MDNIREENLKRLARLIAEELVSLGQETYGEEWIDTDRAAQVGYGYRYDFTGADVLVKSAVSVVTTLPLTDDTL